MNYTLNDFRNSMKNKFAVSVLKVINYAEEFCLVIRDPQGVIDPSVCVSLEDVIRNVRGVEDLGNFTEERLYLIMLREAVNIFSTAIICKTREYEEFRYRGKFVSITNTMNKTPTNFIISKWYYEVELSYGADLDLVLSQEGYSEGFAAQYRRYLPCGVAVFSSDWTMIYSSDFKCSRDHQFSYFLPTGTFYIVPLCGLPKFVEEEDTRDLNLYPYVDPETGIADEKFLDTLGEIFKRYDLMNEKYLRFVQIKHIFEALNIDTTETDYNDTVLKKYDRTKLGITMDGFKACMTDMFMNLDRKGNLQLIDSLSKVHGEDGLHTIAIQYFLKTLCLDLFLVTIP